MIVAWSTGTWHQHRKAYKSGKELLVVHRIVFTLDPLDLGFER